MTRPSFVETLQLPPLLDTVAYNLIHPSLHDALEQNPRARRKIARYSQDNLVASAGNNAELPDMFVPPPFTPLGQKAGEGARTKASLTVTAQVETPMETDAPQATKVQRRPPVPAPSPAKDIVSNVPYLVSEAGMNKWTSNMLKGHPGDRSTTWEQWVNSFANQFKGVVDGMTQSLRIKEDSSIKMFAEKEKIVKDSKGSFEKIKYLEGKYSGTGASLIVSDTKIRQLEKENPFLKEKLKVSDEKLKTEREANINLFSTVRLNQNAAQDATLGSTDEERKIFLSGANCIELTNTVDPQGMTAYCMDTLPEMVRPYSPEGVLFMKTKNPHSVGMLMRMYADFWENLDIDKLKEKQERRRTTSGRSTSSHGDPQPS